MLGVAGSEIRVVLNSKPVPRNFILSYTTVLAILVKSF